MKSHQKFHEWKNQKIAEERNEQKELMNFYKQKMEENRNKKEFIPSPPIEEIPNPIVYVEKERIGKCDNCYKPYPESGLINSPKRKF